jgi:hypothetical protein
VAPGDVAFVLPSRIRTYRVLTLTITEAGYRLDRDGRLDIGDPEVRDDTQLRRGATPP